MNADVHGGQASCGSVTGASRFLIGLVTREMLPRRATRPRPRWSWPRPRWSGPRPPGRRARGRRARRCGRRRTRSRAARAAVTRDARRRTRSRRWRSTPRTVHRSATTAGADLAAERAERVGQHLDAGQPAAHRLGDRLVPDRAAEDAADHVGGAGEHQEDQHAARCSGPGRPARSQRRTPRRRPRSPGRGGGPARSSPSWRSRAGADGLGGVEQAEQLGAREDLLGQRREEHHRHRQQHRGDVDEVGAEQVAAAEARSCSPSPDAAQARRRRLVPCG